MSAKRIPALDGVRGFAVLMVVFYHTAGGAHSSNPILSFVGTIISFGWTGVTLFFVLSGFLITGILHDTRDDPHRFRNFYARRSLRIFPLYYLALAIVVFASLFTHQLSDCLHHLPVYLFYLQNVKPFDLGPAPLPSFLRTGHFWSLAVEEQFYLLWPFLVYRARSLQGTLLLCVAVVAASGVCKMFMPAMQIDSLAINCGALAMGGWIAMMYRTPQWRDWAIFAPFGFLISVLSAILLAHASDGPTGVKLWNLSYMWASLIMMALLPGPVQRLFSIRWLRWFGSISYGMYVYHVLFFNICTYLAARITTHRNPMLALQFVFSFGSTVLLSWLSYKYFESPITRLKGRFQSRTHLDT